jgi:hypothetical protein
MNKLLPPVLALAMTGSVTAQQQPLEAPPPPPPLRSGEPLEALEPEVTIIQRGDETLYEYRVSGQLYMVKVVPAKGPPYYFLDQNGDGQLDAQRYGPGEVSIPQWVLFRW